MKVLVVGAGGREHALAWKIAESPMAEAVLAAPGSAAMQSVAQCHPEIAVGDLAGIVKLCQETSIDLVVVGPEVPLADGLADLLRDAGVATFGPGRYAAQLEASKSFAKAFMSRYQIPTAAYSEFANFEGALEYVRARGHRCVVKADGLAAGKGVAMCETVDQAEAALYEMMQDRRFGDAGSRVVIEDWLEGEEASYYAISDGERIVTLAAAQDHKRALDGDRGENTGGMGAYSPAKVIDHEVEKRILEQIVRPAIRGMKEEGSPYVGVLFVGLMIDPDGNPTVIEFNVRFGDPETQSLMFRMDGDLLRILDDAARGQLDTSVPIRWNDSAVCIVMASEGYPRAHETGRPIAGLDAAAQMKDVMVFHAGTRQDAEGGFETSGGRVLGVTARGASVQNARDRAYAAVDCIKFQGAQFRTDIANRAVGRR